MRTKSLLLGGIALVGIGYGVKKLYDIIKVLKACRVDVCHINIDKLFAYTPATTEKFRELVQNPAVYLGSIDTYFITDMSGLFKDSTREEFSGIAQWDVSNVTGMSDMFNGAKHFNQSLESWDVRNVTNMDRMFEDSGLTTLPSWYKEGVAES